MIYISRNKEQQIEMEHKIIPPHCENCHHTWWPKNFNFKTMQPIVHPRCPICRNNYKEGYKRKPLAAPQPGEEDVALCHCPTCQAKKGNGFFLARLWWIERQYKHCDTKNGQDAYIPTIIKRQSSIEDKDLITKSVINE